MEAGHKKLISNYEVVETLLDVPEWSLLKAIDPSSGTNVLIKIYYPSLTWSDEVLNEFFDRVSYLRFIEHDNLLPLVDIGKYDKVPFVVYSYLSSDLLSDRTFKGRNEKEILSFFYEIGDALDFLHKQEILHGMLAAQNILIDPQGRAKLFDYGLADILRKLLLENTEDGFANLSLSSVESISPEQLRGRTPTRPSDIYSFGVLLFFSLFGEYPFESQLIPEIATWHLNEHVTKINSDSKKISRQVLRFIQKCIQVEPEKRFSNFSELLRVLDRTRQGKITRFSFRKRLELVSSSSQHPKVSWYAISSIVLLAISAWFYIQTTHAKVAPTSAPPTPQITAAEKKVATSTMTQVHLEPTAQINVDTPEVPVVAAYRPAIEGETPRVLSEKISLANISAVGELSRLGYGKPEHVDLSPDNKYLALATSAGVYIYNNNHLDTWIDPQGWATAVQFSPNAQTLAIGLESGEIQLWDWAKGVKTSTLSKHSARISRILFSSNGKILYSASYDRHVIVWNLAQNTTRDIPAHSEHVNDIAVTSDGRFLITCSDDQLVRVWDLASGTKSYEMRFAGKLLALALSSDDVYLAVGGDAGFITQVNVRTRELRTDPIPVRQRVWSLQYIENNTKLLAGIDNGQNAVYDAAQLHYDGISLMFEIRPVPAPLVKIFGFDFVFGSFAVSSGSQSTVFTIRWDGEMQDTGRRIFEPFYDSFDRLDFSDNGNILAASGKQEITSVWNINDNRVLYKNRGRLPQGDPISPDGNHVVVETSGLYRLIDLTNVAVTRDFSQVISDGVISYTDQGKILVAGNLRESKVWDYESGYETIYSSHPENGCLITLSANNQEVLQVNSAAGIVPTWDEETKQYCAKSFLYVNSLSAHSTDMHLLVYQASNGFIEALELTSYKVLWKYAPESKTTNPVMALAVSSDGAIVAIGDKKGNLLLLDGTNGNMLAKLIGNFGSVQSIKFSEDDTKLATTGSDGAVRIFGVIK